MADEQKQSSVQVLPPERRDVQLPPNTPAGIPFLAQAKYWAARRALKSYTKALASQTAAYRELEARERAKVGFERSLVQSEHLDDLRRIEELKIMEELASLVEAGDVRDFRARAVRAQAEGNAIEAEQRLAGIRNPPSAETKPERSAAEQAALDIAQMRADGAALRTALIDSYGGEDKISEVDRGILEQLDVAIRNKVVERLENI